MSRQRMVKPEFYDSESLGMCSVQARFLFIALWVHGNDYGNVKARLSWLKLKTFPYDSLADSDILKMLVELEEVGCIRGYSVDGEPFINVPNFDMYQTVRKPNKSNVPDPPKSLPKRTSFFAEMMEYGTSTAPVPHQYVTSTENDGNAGGTSPVPHQYRTSDAQKKERKKEVVVLQQQLPKGTDPHGADADETAPHESGDSKVPVCPLCSKRVSFDAKSFEWRCPMCGSVKEPRYVDASEVAA